MLARLPRVSIGSLTKGPEVSTLRGPMPAGGGGGSGTPAVSVVGEQAFGQSAAVGFSTNYARQDHTHGSPADPVVAHVAASDPHPGYQLRTEKGAASGYPDLDAGTKVPVAQLPAATTGAKGVAELATSGENAANVVVQGNDARLSDARTPLGHHVEHTSPGGTDQFLGSDMIDAQARTNYLKGGVAVASLRGLNFVEGSSIALTVADAGNPPSTERVNVTVAHRAGAPMALKLRSPANFVAANLTTATVLVTNTSYFVYIGRVADPITTLNVLARVTAAAATITWAEIGVFKGSPVGQGAASLSRVGFTNVAAIYNSTGLKKTAVTVSGLVGGEDLWVAFGSQATTPFQLRAGLADDIQSGIFQQVAGRISTVAVPVATTLAAATLAVPWFMAEL